MKRIISLVAILLCGILCLFGCQKKQNSIDSECIESTCTESELIESNPASPYYGFTAYKPVIYLYPAETTELTVTLDLDGVLTSTYPKYDTNWFVTAKPDGTLSDSNGKQYPYLFWEGSLDTKFNFDTGFCVAGSDTVAFLEESLTQLGLNYKEQTDFITYWLPQMEHNTYNVISFQGDCYTDAAKLTVSTEPDTEFRIFMAWYPSNVFVEIPEQELIETERIGFTLVEWGGSKVEGVK